ncbi:MAG: S-methyl-5'-thioinosine phosphorylase [Burkholderiaceae bacterium]|nr:MAG: S-methyl-5'-thioinosine phosphorylase [Burkholderiaceae bacterium]
MYAIIGGSGLAKLPGMEVQRREVTRTPYGEPSGALTYGEINGVAVVFLARHGYGHTIAPHEINYRANIWALNAIGIDGLISVASVGGITQHFAPGMLAIPEQIIDYTHGRKSSYFEGPETPVTQIDFTHPYTEALRQRLFSAIDATHQPVYFGGVYACMQGPRLETAAEINKLERDGADMVGMTGMPEAALARELELPYAALTVVANYAAGRGDSAQQISFEALNRQLAASMQRVQAIIAAFVSQGN